MTRPDIIRADSIDLQDQVAPSAQDHTRQPAQSGTHHAETLREVAAEAAGEAHRSPRVSKEWSHAEIEQYGDGADFAAGVTAKLNGENLQQQDNLAVAQNGGLTGSTTEDSEMADAEGDDGMEDDMMDKISSSPSIDDGGYSLPNAWPKRLDSLTRTNTSSSSPSSFTQVCNESSSPFVETPDHYPLRSLHGPLQNSLSHESEEVVDYQFHHRHHLRGEYSIEAEDGQVTDEDNHSGSDPEDAVTPLPLHVVEAYRERHQRQHQQLISDEISPVPHNSNRASDVYEQYDDYEFDDDESSLIIPYHGADEEAADDEDDDDDDRDDIPYTDNSRFVDSGWGGECLHESEDIDFEFVYALHTFVATVEGQANATKGDTMVLLDDSNSYWWLVRVVKDSSIGYLPAEHIETPTERLARLNKHRNIDLTSAMLGDQAEKSKNPLKKAIRRRNAKTVTFTAPTYVEATEVDYSTEEEEGDQDYPGQNEQAEAQEQGTGDDESATIEPLKPRPELREAKTESPDRGEAKASSDTARTSDDISEGKPESKSRNGTVRNIDSFFNDSVETRKITLTPNLLRDDSSTSTLTSNDSKELRQRPSLDRLEKDSVSEKNKDKKEKKEKKEKDKKPGMLSGLFKRKEKRSKSQDDEIEHMIAGKPSTEQARGSPVPSKDSEELMATDDQVQTQEVQRQSSKLQKQQRTEVSPSRKSSVSTKTVEPQQIPAPDRPPPADLAQAPSMRLVQPESPAGKESSVKPITEQSSELVKDPTSGPTTSKDKSGGAISKMLRSASSGSSDPKPVKAKKAKSRVELDDFDSSPEASPLQEPTRGLSSQNQRPIPGSFPDSYISTHPREVEDRLSESPVQISPINDSQSLTPALMVDTSSQGEPPSPVSSEMSPSPELIDADDAKKGLGSSTTSASTPTWSDAHLKTFFDDDADIKDLLVVVYDKSGVLPAGPDHPITGILFREENAKLAEITNRLDGMLGDWLARKMRTQASR